MVTQFGQRWCVVNLFVIVTCFLVSLIQSHDAFAERKQISGTGVGTVLGETGIEIPVGDMNSQVGNLRSLIWVYSSTHPDWNNARASTVVFTNVMTKSLKGFTVVTHPGGDQTFLEFEGTWEQEPGVVFTDQRKGRFLGGTGKFKGITGRWTSTIRGGGFDPTVDTVKRTAEWKAEYEIKP